MPAAIAKRRLSRLARSLRKRVFPVRPVEGLPPGLAFETVDAVCRQYAGQRLRGCAYVHLSSWKPHGTYRLELTTEAGRRWTLIFKDERYSAADIPALRTLPIRPGPPEFAIYQMQHEDLTRFLPRTYWLSEVEPACHFQYLIEDLGDRFERISAAKPDLMLAVHALAELQAALKPALASPASSYLIAYDRQYSENLLDYVRRNLEAYRAARGSAAVTDLCQNWQQIVDVHQRDEFYRHGLETPIHGDYNRSNVHVHPRDRTKVKVVDWEWAGIGLPHADLAAVLKRAHAGEERAALEVFARAHGQLDLESHHRLFRWCQLERRLLDAGFIACQEMTSTRQLPWLEKFIAAAAADALRAAKLLRAAPRRAAAA